MIKKLTKHGNSLALIIERPILELLGINADTPLEVSTDGKGLRVVPVVDEDRRARFEKAKKQCIERYSGLFQRLADSDSGARE